VVIPLLRHAYLEGASGFISPTHLSFSNSEHQHPESYKQVLVNVVPSAELDLSGLALSSGQWIALLVAPSEMGRGAILPVRDGERRIQVPADIPILPAIIHNQLPVRFGEVITFRAGETKRPVFRDMNGLGAVVTWIEHDRTMDEQQRVFDSKFGDLGTALNTAGGQTVRPVFPIESGPSAYGELQVFREVPAGRARVILTGDKWEEEEIDVTVQPNAVVATAEGLRAMPAAVLRITYRLPTVPVAWSAATTQSCLAKEEDQTSIRISIGRCRAVRRTPSI
jgi:hypothetical protein